jgi:hypothetical protein
MFAVKPLRILQQKLTVAKANTALQNGADRVENKQEERWKLDHQTEGRKEPGSCSLVWQDYR